MKGNGWQVKSLGEVAELTSGGTPSRDRTDYFVGSIPWVKSGELNNNIIQNVEERISDEAIKNSSAKLFPKGSLLIALYGATVGRLGILGMDAATNQAVAAIKIKTDLEINYLFWFLFSYRTRLLEDRIGGAQPNISLSILKDIKVPLPPLPIQKQIAEILEKADQAKQKRKEANKLTEQFLQSAFIEMFGHQQRECKGITIKKLAEITTLITDGVHAKPIYIEKGVPFISVKDITTGKLLFDKVKYISEEQHRSFIKRCRPEYFDILYTKVGATYGRPALVDTNKEFSLYVSVALIKPNRSIVDPYYLRFALQSESVKLQADKRIKGIGVPDLHLIEIKNFDIIVPPLSLQQQFAELVQKTETLKEKQKASEKELENLFNSLMQKAFKGELSSIQSTESTIANQKPKMNTTDLQAGIVTKIIVIHSTNSKYQATLGHVKVEKICHILEYHLDLDIGRTPVRIAAGPADFKHLKQVEHRARMKNWFTVTKSKDSSRYKYSLGKSYEYLLKRVSEELSGNETEIDDIINLFAKLDSHQTEVVVTTYAAWNDLLMEGKKVSNKDIVYEAREKWTESKLKIEEEKFFKSIEWLQRNNLTPKGNGKHTVMNL